MMMTVIRLARKGRDYRDAAAFLSSFRDECYINKNMHYTKKNWRKVDGGDVKHVRTSIKIQGGWFPGDLVLFLVMMTARKHSTFFCFQKRERKGEKTRLSFSFSLFLSCASWLSQWKFHNLWTFIFSSIALSLCWCWRWWWSWRYSLFLPCVLIIMH